jgi:hypothetical protein
MKTKKFIELLKDTKKKKDDQLSPKEKLDLYGITIEPIEENVKQFKGYYMKSIDLYDVNDNKIKGNTFQVVKKVDLLKKKWYFVFEEDKEVKKGKKKSLLIMIMLVNYMSLYAQLLKLLKLK